MNRDVVSWLESPEGEEWSRKTHRGEFMYALVVLKEDYQSSRNDGRLLDSIVGLVWSTSA